MKYYFAPSISFESFKEVLSKFPDTSGGPTPMHIDEILWQGLRDRAFNIYIDSKCPDDPIVISTEKLPKKVTAIIGEKK